MKQKANAWIDITAFVAGIVSLVSGIVLWLMPSGGYRGGRVAAIRPLVLGIDHAAWSDLHVWSSFALVALVLVHLVLHWCWIRHLPRILSGGRKKASEAATVCETVA